MPTNIPSDHGLRHLEGYDTVPRVVPPQRYTLCFLGGLVALTYFGFFTVMVLGVPF